ncbi:hypothetical protein AB0P21_20530 [Kribbella sp. NPDC056861]|uniref:hypothetical protein n=1 Tax=Kribbella sp. NPDC056861 TaxID=3154857 RepID=UPI003442B4C9
MTAPPTRWPLHPQPGPLESLSSWVDRLADRTASDLGFGIPLVEVFANREFERATSGWRPERLRPGASQPIETTRLRWLEKYLKSVPSDVHQRPWAG